MLPTNLVDKNQCAMLSMSTRDQVPDITSEIARRVRKLHITRLYLLTSLKTEFTLENSIQCFVVLTREGAVDYGHALGVRLLPKFLKTYFGLWIGIIDINSRNPVSYLVYSL